MSAGALIFYRCVSDGATITATAGTVNPSFPLANLKTRQLSKISRISNVSLSTMQLALKIDRGVGTPDITGGVVALLAINADPASPVPMSLSLKSSATDGSYVQIGNLTGLNDGGARNLPRCFIVQFTGTLRRWATLTASWGVPSGVTYGDVGRLWLGDAIAIPSGADADFELDLVDPGTLDMSDGGQAYENKKTKLRALKTSFTGLPADLAFGFSDAGSSALDVPSFQDMQSTIGCAGELIVVPRTSSEMWQRRLSVYGHVDPSSRPSIVKQAGDNYGVSFVTIEER